MNLTAQTKPEELVPISLGVRTLCFSGGQEISLDPNTILVLVGPNNAGKSRALFEIKGYLKSARARRVVTKVDYSPTGNPGELEEWAQAHLMRVSRDEYRGIGGALSHADIEHWPGYSKPLIDHLCILARAEERFAALRNAPSINAVRDPESHPLHLMLTREQTEHHISSLVRAAFGVDVIINKLAGLTIKIHCGERPQHSDRANLEYLRALEGLPTLEEQGDGLKSFLGCLVQVILGPWDIVLLDEPEMFLHPPQAELLGEVLARDVPADRQLVIATHSSDLLQGVLRCAGDRVKLARIVRNGNNNDVCELSRDDIAALRGEPVLRFTNALDGLFRQSVVVCEGHADCRFYEEMFGIVNPDEERPLFVPAGSKQSLRKFLVALRKLGVPSCAVPDLDVVDDKKVLSQLWESTGGSWHEIEGTWEILRAGVETYRKVPTRKKTLEDIQKILKERSNDLLDKDDSENVKKCIKNTTSWAMLKEGGLNALPQGAAAEAGNLLLEKLTSRDIYAVPVGVLERFEPTINAKSYAWLSVVLTRDLKNDPQLEPARRFVKNIAPKRIAIARTRQQRPSVFKIAKRFVNERRHRNERPLATVKDIAVFIVKSAVYIALTLGALSLMSRLHC